MAKKATPDKRKTPGKRKRNTRAGETRAERTIARAVEAYGHYLQDLTVREVAKKIRCSKSRAGELIQMGREEMLRPPVDAIIDKHIDQCTALRKVFYPKAIAGDTAALTAVLNLTRQIDSYHDSGHSKPNVTKQMIKASGNGPSIVVKSVTRRILAPGETPPA